jgi:hypothetical protein
VRLTAQRYHDLGLLPGNRRLIEQAMLLGRIPVGAKLCELVAIIAALLSDAWRRLRGRGPAQNIPEQAVQQQASATQIELVPEGPEKATALMSLALTSPAQITVHHMRFEGTLCKLTGDGELDEQDLEAEWQQKLETSPNWQEKLDCMTSHQKKEFFRVERYLFIKGIHNAFARAQAKLEEQAKPKPGHLDLADALAKFQHDRLRELDGFPPELPQETLQKLPQALETFV